MPRTENSSPIAWIATTVSVVLAVALGVVLMRPQPQAPPTAPPPPAVAAAPEPTPAPAAADAPTTETVAIAPTPPPTPAPTAAPTLPPPGTLFLSGAVEDASGELVPGAEVFAARYTGGPVARQVAAAFTQGGERWIARTDSLGFYEIELESGRDYIVGLMQGGRPTALVQRVNPPREGGSIEANFTVPRPVTIRGTVTDQHGDPAAAIPVQVGVRGGAALAEDDGPSTVTLATDEEGAFSLDALEPERIVVAIDRAGLPRSYFWRGVPVTLLPADWGETQSYRIDMQVVRGVSLRGVVVEGSRGTAPGAPIAEALVRLAADGEGEPVAEATAGLDGGFRFPDLPPGRYRLAAAAPGFAEHPGDIIDLSRDADREVALQPLARLRVVVDSGDAAGPARVALLSRHSARQTRVDLSARARATTEFDGLVPAAYLATALIESADGPRYAEAYVPVGGEDGLLEVELKPSALRSARGRLAAGLASAEAVTIRARAVGGSATPDSIPWASAELRRSPAASTTSGGAYRLDDLRADADYMLLAEDRATGAIIGSAILNAAMGEGPEIALNGTGTISGRAISTRNEACTGTVLELIAGPSVAGAVGRAETRRAVIAYDGGFRFEHVPAGQARLILGGDTRTARLVAVEPGGSVSVALQCRAIVPVSFDLADSAERPLRPSDQFFILPAPGSTLPRNVIEITYARASAELEPGNYIITRTSTMDSRPFEVLPHSAGRIRVDFGTPENP